MSKNVINKKEKIFEKIIERRYYNYEVVLYFCMGSITLLFLGLSLSYFFNSRLIHAQKSLTLPPIIFINSFILLFSSIILEFIKKAFNDDNIINYKNILYLFIISIFIFISLQIYIWVSLSKIGFDLQHNSAAFLFLISGFHVLHIIGGLIFILSFHIKHWKNIQNNITSLVFFSDKTAYLQLKLFSIYWHFLTAVWLYLLFFFCLIR